MGLVEDFLESVVEVIVESVETCVVDTELLELALDTAEVVLVTDEVGSFIEFVIELSLNAVLAELDGFDNVGVALTDAI